MTSTEPSTSLPRWISWSRRGPTVSALYQVPACRFTPAGWGAYFTRVQFANSLYKASGLRKLIALSLLAGLGFGVALAHGDLLFVAF